MLEKCLTPTTLSGRPGYGVEHLFRHAGDVTTICGTTAAYRAVKLTQAALESSHLVLVAVKNSWRSGQVRPLLRFV